jgi:transposase
MAKQINTSFVQIINPVCCGLDIHKNKISACLITVGKNGQELHELKEFDTYTKELFSLKKWLDQNSCPVVAMESTGVYWRPVHNILEKSINVTLVNARHIKNVPGRKTDISDCKWLAGLLRHGLLKSSFIPPEPIREIRDLSRLAKTYTESTSDYKRRVHKLFTTANIKIDSVVTDLFGKTGRNLIHILCSKSDISVEDIKNNAAGSLKLKVKELHESIQGFFNEHHRFQLNGLMETIVHIENQTKQIRHKINKLTETYHELIDRLDEIPGVDKKSAQAIIGEVGVTLEEFESASAFVSWAGLCPGNNESAGKRKNGKISIRDHHLRTILIQVAWAAVKKNASYYKAKYYHLKARRGSKRAIVAISHRIAKSIYFIIKHGDTYCELGEDYLLTTNKQKSFKNLRKKAEKLGYDLVPQT